MVIETISNDDDADDFGDDDDDPSLVGRVRLGNNFFDMIIVEMVAMMIIEIISNDNDDHDYPQASCD